LFTNDDDDDDDDDEPMKLVFAHSYSSKPVTSVMMKIKNTFIRPKTETDRQADRYIQMKKRTS